jgi:adenine-specific DNA-methyltransferase
MQKSYFNQIKMIYIDPPYNTGHDFVYKDNFKNGIKAYLEQTGQLNGDGVLLTTNPETSGRFHSDWISMIYPRLFLARNLMREDGVIFVSIDDHEVHNLRRIMDEIFGEENFLGIACRVAKKTNNKGNFYAPNFDYLLTYSKNKEDVLEFGEEANEESYSLIETEGKRKGDKYQLIRLYMSSIRNENPEQRYFIECPDGSKIIPPGKTFPPKKPEYGDGIWRWTKVTFEKNKDRIVIKKVRSSNLLDEKGNPARWNVYTKTYLKDVIASSSIKPNSLIEEYINELGTEELGELGIPFDFPKPSALIKYLMKISKVQKNDIVLDFFAGSGTTAHAVMDLNRDGASRRFILIQLPEKTEEKSEAYKQNYKTIADIAKERIRRVIKKLEKEEKAKLAKKDIDLGFKVFKLEKSNYKIWENYEGQDIKELTKQLDLFKNPLINGYDDYNVIYECIVKEGLNLNAKIETRDINGNKIYKVSDGTQSFYICLDEKIKQENLNKLDLKKDDLFICLDSSLDDSKKVNISTQCKLKTL